MRFPDSDPDAAEARRLLRRKDRFEAAAWLKGSDKRNIGEMSNKDATALVRKLYEWGAVKVIVAYIKENAGYESTDHVVVTLPDDAKARQRITRWISRHTQRMGFDPVEDHGQRHAFVWFD